MNRRSLLLGAAAALSAATAVHATGPGRLRMGRPGQPVLPPPTDLTPTVSVAANERKLLNLTALQSVPIGNSVTLASVAGAGKLNLVTSSVYRDGDVLMGPGPTWINTPTTTPPTDPVRTTAQPVARLLVETYQRLTGDFTLVVDAEAGDSNPTGPGGIASVMFECEGATHTSTTKQVYYDPDVNGKGKATEGYCVTLDHSAFMSQLVGAVGEIAVYITVTANDGTMQTRVLGVAPNGGTTYNNSRIRYYISATPFTHRINLTPSAVSVSENVSAIYPAPRATLKTLDDCIAFYKGLAVSGVTTLAGGSPSCEIYCTESTDQLVTTVASPSAYYHPTLNGAVIKAAPGATLTIRCATTWETRASGIVLEGANVVFNRTVNGGIAGAIYMRPGTADVEHKNANIKPYGVNGITITTDRDYQQFLQDNGKCTAGGEIFTTNTGSGVGEGWYWVRDVVSRNAVFPACSMVLNSDLDSVIGDFGTATGAFVGCRMAYADKTHIEGAKNSLTVAISGSGGDPYVKVIATGGLDAVYVQQATDPTLIGGGGTNAALYASPTYSKKYDMVATPALQRIQPMVDAINADTAAHGITASVPAGVTIGDNYTDRNLLGLTGDNVATGLGGNVVMRSAGVNQATANLQTSLQLHTDFADLPTAGGFNLLLKNNIIFLSAGFQAPWIDANTTDCAYINNQFRSGGLTSSIQNRTHSHLLILHNSMNQSLLLDSSSGWATDAYCRIANNACATISRTGANPQAPMVIEHNTGTSFTGVTGTNTVASTMTTLIPTYDTGNPEPIGSIPTVAPYTARDFMGQDRPSPAPVGPKAFRLTTATLTRQQALDLAAANLNEPSGAGVNVATLTWKDGAGNTGNTVTLTLTLDAA